MIEKFGPKGFEVLFVTGTKEDVGKTDAWIEKHGAKGHVIYEDGLASMKSMGLTGLPSSVLISPKGKILWKGHPSNFKDDLVEANIGGASKTTIGDSIASINANELSKKHKGIASGLAKGKLGKSLKSVEKGLANNGDDPELKGIQARIMAVLNIHAAAAKKAEGESRYFDAMSEYETIAKAFKGHDKGKEAKSAGLAIKKNKELKKELDAGRMIHKALKELEAGKKDRAAKLLKMLATSSSLGDTLEAKRAQTLLDTLK